MKTTNLVTAFILAAALVACGGKAKKATTPDPNSSQTQMKANGSAMGGSTYGGTMTPAGGTPAPTSGGADPCAPTK